MAGSDNDSDDASIHNEATNTQQQPNIQPQIITTVSNNNARTGRDHDGRVIILPPTTAEEHIAVQRESKARTTLLQSIPDDHSMLKQEFLEFRIGEAEGLHKGYDMMQKILSQLPQLKAKPYVEDINLKFLRALPSSWSQIEKLDLEEMDLKWQMAMLSVRVHKFEQKARRKINFDKKESASKSDGVIAAKEFGMIAGCDSEDAIKEGAAKLYNLITGANSEKANTAGDAREFALMGVTSEVHKCPFGCDNKYNELKKQYNELNEQNNEYFIQDQTYKNSLKTLEKQKRVLQRNQLTLEDKIRVLSIELENTSNLLKHYEKINADFETVKKDLQTKLDNHLVQNEKWRNSSKNPFRLIDSSMSVRTKVGLGFTNCISENELGWDDYAFSVFTTNSEDVEAVPPPLSGDYTSLSDHIDLDESQMSYGTKSSTFSDSKSVSNDFLSCDDSDKSLEVNTNDFASSDSSVKSSEHKPTDSTSCESTSSVSTSVNEAEIESNFVSQAVLLRTGKVHIPPVRPQPVPTGKPKVTPVPTGKPKVTPVPTGKPKVTPVPTGKTTVTPIPTEIYGQLLLSPQQVVLGNHIEKETPFSATKDEGIFDSGCSRSMTSNKERLDDFQAFQGRKVTFGGGEGRITGKGALRSPKLDFENVYYVKELQQFNLLSITQICDKKNQVLFTDTECLVLSKDFKLLDYSMVVLRVPRKYNLYTINLNNLCPREHKDETYPILKDFINLVGNQLNTKVKAIRCDNGTEFKNAHMIDFYGSKGIKREYSNPRTPQQNGIAERKNRTLIEAARTMLADSKLPTMFWTEAVRTACYVLNRVSVTSPHNKTPYALLTGIIPSVSYFKPFGCHVTILNTSDHLGKFDGKADEGYIVRYSASNKAYRVYNVPNKRVEESMNLRATTNSAGTQAADLDSDCDEQVIIELARLKDLEQRVTSDAESLSLGFLNNTEELQTQTSAKTVPPGCIPVPPGKVRVPTGSLPVPTGIILILAAATKVSTDDVPVYTSSSTDSIFDDEPTTRFSCPLDLGNHDPPHGIFSSSSYDDDFGAALNNVASTVEVSPVATTRLHTIHPQSLIIGDPTSAVQTRSKALKDPSWVDVMLEKMQQFKFQNVWVLVDFPTGKYAIGTKWILKNKRDARGIVVRNKARLLAQGHRQEEGIDYDE
nr:putative ribonuclease H-like domain-containing protein [Tanacetum cinerariifolium]